MITHFFSVSIPLTQRLETIFLCWFILPSDSTQITYYIITKMTAIETLMYPTKYRSSTNKTMYSTKYRSSTNKTIMKSDNRQTAKHNLVEKTCLGSKVGGLNSRTLLDVKKCTYHSCWMFCFSDLYGYMNIFVIVKGSTQYSNNSYNIDTYLMETPKSYCSDIYSLQ